MAIFVVMEPPRATGAGEPAVYVRDGFHWLAFLVPPVWFLWHRMWIEALITVAAMLAIGAVAQAANLTPAASFISLLVSIGIGLEAPTLRLWALRRRGWRQWGVVEASSPADAQLRHLLDLGEPAAIEPRLPDGASAPQQAPRLPAGPALGLFSYPGGN